MMMMMILMIKTTATMMMMTKQSGLEMVLIQRAWSLRSATTTYKVTPAVSILPLISHQSETCGVNITFDITPSDTDGVNITFNITPK